LVQLVCLGEYVFEHAAVGVQSREADSFEGCPIAHVERVARALAVYEKERVLVAHEVPPRARHKGKVRSQRRAILRRGGPHLEVVHAWVNAIQHFRKKAVGRS
jgi:hypothetical protein